jgi:hypothetical protein
MGGELVVGKSARVPFEIAGNAQGQVAALATSTAVAKKTIQAAQERLQALGYQPGLADGVMGATANAALKKFQSDRGLSADAVLDRKTMDALNIRPEEVAAEPTESLIHTPAKGTEKYRVLTPDDGLSCAFSQDLSLSLNAGFGGSVTGTTDHFKCTDKQGKEISIDLNSVEPVDGKIEIKTKQFGTILRGNEAGSLDKYEMTASQITKLKAFLGF